MGKKIRKAIGALFVAVAIAVTQIPVSDVRAVDGTSGNTAPVSEFQTDGTTLVKYNGTSANVSIGDYIEKIESGAFADNEYLKTVVIGNNVTTIGTGAFEGCSLLEAVTIPDSVKTIEKAAFADCPSLTAVGIGTGLNSLGSGVFAGDVSLGRVNISSSNSRFTCDEGAIYNKNGRDTLYAVLAGRKSAEYVMPSTVTKIMPYAFWGNRYLESVTISGGVLEISAYAFSNCANLKKVTIPYSVSTIGLKAFENCIRLRSISIPVSVQSIHSTAFDGCTRLTIDAPEGSTAKEFADNLVLEDIDVTEYEDTPIDTISDTDIEDDSETDGEAEDASLPVDYYHEVTHMSPLEDEEDAAVKGKSKIIDSQVFVFVDNASATVNSGVPDLHSVEGAVFGETGETIASISNNSNEKGGSFPKYTIIEDKVIANQAYYNDNRESIDIPDTITEIGEFAFARSAITNVVLPEGVTKIGYAAFYHCDGLTDVVIPNTVTEIASSAFENTPWLQNWRESGSGDFLIVGDGILLDYRGSNSVVTIPGGVKTIGADALQGHTEITKVILPDSVEVIGEGAFSNCSALTDIEGGNSVRKMKDRAFAGCPIENIRIPASVEEIGLKAFAVADSVKSAGTGKVVFEGSSIPSLSYEASSGKLYHDDYRGLAFEGVKEAIVPEGTDVFENTVLDKNLQGFRGVIQTAGSGAAAENTADDAADTQSSETDGLQNADDMQSADNMQDTDDSAVADTRSEVTVHIDSRSIEDGGLAGAILEGAETSYLLDIVDSSEARDAILGAYRKLYGNRTPSNLQAYDITLTEEATSIPITGLGRQKIEITIPIPNGIGEENLHVVCLDADGQLEEAESRIASVDGMDYLVFTTNHFSPYGIYNYASGDMATVRDGQAVFTSLSGNKDDSPNTGDDSIHPKWFLFAGCLFTGLALLLYRGKRRIIKIS
ncbi:MAG: leucine-rich repeat protein [Muribaculaceae bacterium]|nr:leucine-rich repeat protein [Muribaculaceae bacterium]